jgi:flavin reductase (DIM6/NTAB) family NADH-FMN oxidoreductase RutF
MSLSVAPVASSIAVDVDPQILSGAIANSSRTLSNSPRAAGTSPCERRR